MSRHNTLVLRWSSIGLHWEVVNCDVSEYVECSAQHLSEGWEPGYTTGFIDWLRKNGRIVGVAFTPFGRFEELFTQFDEEYMIIEAGKRLLFFFGDVQQFDRMDSADQELRRVRVFARKGDSLQYTLAVHLDNALATSEVFRRKKDGEGMKRS